MIRGTDVLLPGAGSSRPRWLPMPWPYTALLWPSTTLRQSVQTPAQTPTKRSRSSCVVPSSRMRARTRSGRAPIVGALCPAKVAGGRRLLVRQPLRLGRGLTRLHSNLGAVLGHRPPGARMDPCVCVRVPAASNHPESRKVTRTLWQPAESDGHDVRAFVLVAGDWATARPLRPPEEEFEVRTMVNSDCRRQ